MKYGKLFGDLLVVALALFLIIGELLCVVRAVRCDWNPIGKAEVIYTGAALCGAGGIVGWIDIDDE